MPGLLTLGENGSVGSTAEQGSGRHTAVADDQFLEKARSGVECHVVNLAEFVASIAKGPLPDQLEFPFCGGPFSVVRRQPEGTFIDHHDGIGPEPAQLRPIDQLRFLASSNDHGGNPPLLRIHE